MKKLLIFTLITAITISQSACVFTLDQVSVDSTSSKSESSVSSYESSVSSYESSVSPLESSLPLQESSSPQITPAVKIASLNELRDYLNAKKEQDIFEIEFEYVGDPNEVNGETIARITAACCITWWCENGNEYRILIYEYPGDRIADAYRTGNTDKLNSEERLVLAEAERIVNEAKAKADTELELEILLHDAIADNVLYIAPSTDVPDPNNPPRHLTAVGALLDKEANCQGYADAFYLLATMAGFTVGRMNVYNDDGWHLVNTILLDNEWYVVDVTFDDTVLYSDGIQPSYRFLNAGRNACVEYVWGSEMEYHRLADKCDESYFYFNDCEKTDFEYEKTFSDIDSLAEMMVNKYLADGTDEFQTLLLGQTADWTLLSDALKGIETNGVRFKYTIWAYSNNFGTFFLVRFAQN